MAAANDQPVLSFLGAAKTVTGSRFLVETRAARVLVDCGLCQERELQSRNWEPFPVPADRLDAVLLTHAHLDHCGLLPRLAKEGFRGRIHCTGPTAEIAKIVMLDSARLQAEDVENKKKRHEREGRTSPRPLVPLYSEEDAEAAARLFAVVEPGAVVEVADGMRADFHEAGHILGSSSIRLHVGPGSSARRILFSGDIGRWGTPILNDPAPCDGADYVVMESTYGDSLHGRESGIAGELARVVNETAEAGGNVVIPSFAIERSQEVLYHLNRLLAEDRIPHVLTFLDSPMAVKVTGVFAKWTQFHDADMQALSRAGRSPFDLPGLVMTGSVEESKAINRVRGTAIIIAGSGMATGGRIKHHLARNITRRESTILFVGYQASGTLGRQILDGARRVRILGEELPVRARIARINGFSAHADRDELLRWAGVQSTPPRRAFVVHGEPEVAERFRATLSAARGWTAAVPGPGDRVDLE